MLTVEVIEDDPAMRALLLEWLADEGYRVQVRARVGVAAISGVAAVVVNLSNLSLQGAETIRHVKRLYPGAALIGLSTQVIEPLAADSRQAQAWGLDELVPKPCSRRVLVGAVAGAIVRVA